jgi:DNA helicase IV
MAKRLQVILQDPEYREIQRMARSRRMSIAEWVRQALEFARRREPVGDSGKKLAVIRAAAQHEFPVSSIEEMLADIEQG